MLFSIKLDLSPQQLVSLKSAMSRGVDFKTRLSGQQLMAGNFSIDVNKALYNKVIKHHAQGKGMVITLPASILTKLAKTMDITVPEDIPLKAGAGHMVKPPPKRTPRTAVRGGAITAGSAMMSLGMANEFLNDYPSVKQFLGGMGEDIKYLFENPLAVRFKFIVSTKIPNLNKRYADISTDIEATQKRKALLQPTQKVRIRSHDRRIINLETLRDKVGNHLKSLVERLPIIRQMAEERNEVLKERNAQNLEKQIERTESRLESLQKGADRDGEGLQVGRGLQIDPAPMYYGNGVVIDKIKTRIKKNHIDPMIEREKAKLRNKIEMEKAKLKKQMEKEIANAKVEAQKKVNAEISKQKSKLSGNLQGLNLPVDVSQYTGGCMNCYGAGKKKK